MSADRPYPRFRRDLVVRQLLESGEVAWTIHDPVRNIYYRHDRLTHEICELLDGRRGATAVATALMASYPQYDFPLEWVDERVDELRRGGFLEESFSMNEMQRARARAARNRFAPESLTNIFNIQFGVVDPTLAFNLVYPVARIAFERWFVIGSVFAFFAACGLLWERRDALAVGLATMFTLQDSNWLGILLLWFILFGVVVAHEFGHGLACKHFGGQPKRIGFMLMYLMPGMFCDVSDIYFFESRWKRAAVALAGGYVEILCFTASTFIWVGTPPDVLLHDLAFRVMLFSGMTGLIFNYNPLIKLDGYYVLMSWLDIPDLRERSFKYVGDLFRRHVLRLPVELERITRHERRAFLAYGTLAMMYSLFYAIAALLFIRGFLVGNFREVGFGLFAILFFYATRGLWKRLYGGARYLALEKSGLVQRHFAAALAVVVVLVGALLVPLPHRVKVAATLAATDRREIVAPHDGRVEDVLVDGGERVGAGTVVALVRVTGEGGEATAGRAETERGDTGFRRARRGAASSGEPSALAALPLARARAAVVSSADARSFIVSPREGDVLTLRPRRWIGRTVEAGDFLFEIGRSDSLDVLLVASEREIVDLGIDRHVDLRLRSDPGRSLSFRVVDVDWSPRGGPVLALPTAELVDSERKAEHFVARGRIANPERALRPGMTGIARVDAMPLNLLQRAGRFYARIVRADFWL